jgi:predicted ATP-dependent protease
MEAARSGYKKCVIPKGNEKYISQLKGINEVQIIGVKTINEALEHLE